MSLWSVIGSCLLSSLCYLLSIISIFTYLVDLRAYLGYDAWGMFI